jgi:DNA-directed RNA polymerase specialized sigma24 family protein
MDLRSLDEAEKAEILEQLGDWVFHICIQDGMQMEDALDLAQLAVWRLIQNWDKVNARYGIPSLKRWLIVTANRERFKIHTKEKRDITTSLHAETDDGFTLEDEIEDVTVEDEFPILREETIAAVEVVIGELPKRCALTKTTACRSECTILRTWISPEQGKLAVREMASIFGFPQGTMNDRLNVCRDRFENIWALKIENR